jgi:hypothetical protein
MRGLIPRIRVYTVICRIAIVNNPFEKKVSTAIDYIIVIVK